MASSGPGTATAVSQTVSALCRLLITHVVPLVESPFPPTPSQLEDAFYALCAALEDVPQLIPPTPSPLFGTTHRLPELEETHIPQSMDTPGSTTVDLGHEAEMSPFTAATQVLLATDATDLISNDAAWEFELMDNSPPARITATQVLLATDTTDLVSNDAAWEFELMDNSPPARPPSPVSPHPSTNPCPSPKSDVAMEIPWGPCDGCHLMALLASVPMTEDP